MLFNNGREVVNIGGATVETDALKVVEKLRDISDTIEVICVDPAQADFNEAPFIVCERLPNGQLVRILETWQLDDKVVERIIMADTTRFDINARIDQINESARQRIRRRFTEEREEARDKLIHLVRSPKLTYTLPNANGEVVKIDSHRGRIN